MTGGGGGGHGKDDRDGDSESFADLVGETKPISRGRARVENVKREAPIRRAPRVRAQTVAFRWPDPEEPRLAAAPGTSDAQLFALRRGETAPEEKIDLHGLRRDAAGRLLADRIQSAHARGLRCVVVVHGRGKRSEAGVAVLREAVPGWLSGPTCAKHLLGFAPAPQQHGGEGALLVLLRRS